MTLEFNNFGISYKDKDLFQGLNARLDTGQSLAILGCNGVGKSSFLKAICDNFKNDNPRITHDFESFSYLGQSLEIRRDIPITIREYVEFARIIQPKLTQNDINSALELFDIQNISGSNIQTASGGQIMLSRLARIHLERSDLILLDEPFAPLDNSKTLLLMDVIKHWKSNRRSLIVTIHDEELAEGFDHFITLDGQNSFWEKKCPHHDHNCQFSHREYINSSQTH